MLFENRNTRVEGVCGEDGVELMSSGVSRWINRWMFHRWWLAAGVTSWLEAVVSRERWRPFSVSKVSLVELLDLVCGFSLLLVAGLCNFWAGPIN
ncbi:hypothetical protein DY000_02054412 [Brassica cretica]|uniref:Transmembrane protein n=1 Tax=Brassica cretica TaxID=69181 RepID=A0ABQ7AAA4_BRACR|nr:hypothetical protein DY000_02054412 [Brassica cretica]